MNSSTKSSNKTLTQEMNSTKQISCLTDKGKILYSSVLDRFFLTLEVSFTIFVSEVSKIQYRCPGPLQTGLLGIAPNPGFYRHGRHPK
jgi:hypothetical protein